MIAVSDQFNSLTVFNSNQYKTLCDFFHDFTLSNRLPLANEAITEADVTTTNPPVCLIYL